MAKKCNSCGETKGVKQFYKDKKIKGGYKGICKVCTAVKDKEYRKAVSALPTAVKRLILWSGPHVDTMIDTKFGIVVEEYAAYIKLVNLIIAKIRRGELSPIEFNETIDWLQVEIEDRFWFEVDLKGK